MSRYRTPKASSSPPFAHLIAVVRSGGAAQKRSGQGRERDAVQSTRKILMYPGISRTAIAICPEKSNIDAHKPLSGTPGGRARRAAADCPGRVTKGAGLALTKLSRIS